MPDHEYVKGWMTHVNGGKCCKVCGGSRGDHYKPMLIDGVEPVTRDRIEVEVYKAASAALWWLEKHEHAGPS